MQKVVMANWQQYEIAKKQHKVFVILQTKGPGRGAEQNRTLDRTQTQF